jgi:hypothetical protein
MSSILPWNPFVVCGNPQGGAVSCCGVTKKSELCKNSVKVEDTKIGHQKLTTVAREPFDLSTLQPKLCDIAKEFLCARWHRQRQADQVGQQWYEAAVRTQMRVLHCSRMAPPSVVVHPGQRQASSTSRGRPVSGNTDRSPHGLRQDPPVPLSTSPREHDFGSPRWRYKTPEATSGLLGATWFLEAAYMLPETALKTPGARYILGPKCHSQGW